jgi:hypothetical protein
MTTAEQMVAGDGEVHGALLEAVLSRELSHSNIVQTHDYALRSETVRPPACGAALQSPRPLRCPRS